MEFNQPVFDPAQFDLLLELCDDNDYSVIEEVLTQFFADLAKLLEQLDQGTAHSDYCVVADAAHTLKGSCSVFGMIQVQTASRELELAAQAENPRDVERWVRELRDALGPGCEAIRTRMASLKKA